MAKRYFFQWIPKDWVSDAGVLDADIHTRGVWFEMLNLMFLDGDNYQITKTPEQLAKTIRCSVKQIIDAIFEIEFLKIGDISPKNIGKNGENIVKKRKKNERITIVSRRFKKDFFQREKDKYRKRGEREKASCPDPVRDLSTDTRDRAPSNYNYDSNYKLLEGESEGEKKPGKKTAPEFSEEVERLFCKCLDWLKLSGHKIPETNSQAINAKDVFRLMIERDKCSPEAIASAWEFVCQDTGDGGKWPGWRAVVQSVAGFRKHYPMIAAQVRSKKVSKEKLPESMKNIQPIILETLEERLARQKNG